MSGAGHQRLIRNTIRDFVQKECPDRPGREMDEKQEIPAEVFSALAGVSVCGSAIPPSEGFKRRQMHNGEQGFLREIQS